MSDELIEKAYDEMYGNRSLSDHFYDSRQFPEVDPKEIAEEYKHVKEGKMSINEMREVMGLPRILDSGNRRQFESGAVRDIQEGKGRCDLLPLDIVGQALGDEVIKSIYSFVNSGDARLLYCTLSLFNEKLGCDKYTLILEVAKHFEEGCKKYGKNNWQKGIPVHCYIDSGVRHYLKFLRGDKDEPHDRAFCWNIMCAIWTCKHKPELNEYAVNKATEDIMDEGSKQFHIPKKILLGEDDCAKPMEEPV